MTGRWTTTLAMAAAASALTLAGAGALPAQETDFRWSESMREGRTLEVRNIAGDVRASLADGATAEVVATKRGDRSDFDEVEVLVFDEGDRVVVCAVWGSWRSRDSCNHEDGDDRRDRWDRDESIDVSVDFEVRVPAGVDFDGRTVSGDVEAFGLRSDVSGRTVSGNVEIATTGSARGATVSGDLDLEMGRLPDRASFKTVSGDITLRLPEGLDADIAFESLSGDFDSDVGGSFEREDGKWVGTEVWGTLGSGGPRITLETVSGDARLMRARRR